MKNKMVEAINVRMNMIPQPQISAQDLFDCKKYQNPSKRLYNKFN